MSENLIFLFLDIINKLVILFQCSWRTKEFGTIPEVSRAENRDFDELIPLNSV